MTPRHVLTATLAGTAAAAMAVAIPVAATRKRQSQRLTRKPQDLVGAVPYLRKSFSQAQPVGAVCTSHPSADCRPRLTSVPIAYGGVFASRLTEARATS